MYRPAVQAAPPGRALPPGQVFGGSQPQTYAGGVIGNSRPVQYGGYGASNMYSGNIPQVAYGMPQPQRPSYGPPQHQFQQPVHCASSTPGMTQAGRLGMTQAATPIRREHIQPSSTGQGQMPSPSQHGAASHPQYSSGVGQGSTAPRTMIRVPTLDAFRARQVAGELRSQSGATGRAGVVAALGAGRGEPAIPVEHVQHAASPKQQEVKGEVLQSGDLGMPAVPPASFPTDLRGVVPVSAHAAAVVPCADTGTPLATRAEAISRSEPQPLSRSTAQAPQKQQDIISNVIETSPATATAEPVQPVAEQGGELEGYSLSWCLEEHVHKSVMECEIDYIGQCLECLAWHIDASGGLEGACHPQSVSENALCELLESVLQRNARYSGDQVYVQNGYIVQQGMKKMAKCQMDYASAGMSVKVSIIWPHEVRLEAGDGGNDY